MDKHRTIAQDAAKGLMIIAVIFFHCHMYCFETPSDSLEKFNFLMVLFPFLLNAFFFYAGYNYNPSERTFKEKIARRAKQLLIPLAITFVISTVLIGSMELIFHYDSPIATLQSLGNTLLYSLMSEPMALMIHFPQSGGLTFELLLALGLLWFLYALFICSIFFYLLVDHTNKHLSTLVSVVVGLLLIAFCLGQFVGVYLPYTVQCYPVILAIMLTASYLRQSHFLNRRITSKKDSIMKGINMLVAEGIIIAICLVCYYQFGATTTGSLPGGKFDAKLKGFDAFVAYAFGILGTYFLHTLCRLIKHIPVVGACLQWVGNHSAIFYLFHPVFLELAAIAVFQKRVIWKGVQEYVYVAIIVALLVLTCLLIDLIFKKKHKHEEIIEKIRTREAPEDI